MYECQRDFIPNPGHDIAQINSPSPAEGARGGGFRHCETKQVRHCENREAIRGNPPRRHCEILCQQNRGNLFYGLLRLRLAMTKIPHKRELVKLRNFKI